MIAGIAIISVLVEAFEFGLVTAIHGGPTSQPEAYYAIRFLGLKLVENTIAAVVGGLVAALIAGFAPIGPGLA